MSSSPGGNSCRAVKFPPVFFSFLRFFMTYSPHLSSLYLLEMDLVWIQMINILFTRAFFIKFVARGASALRGLADFMRQLSASESIKQTGWVRNQTLVCWFKAWASHKAMALKYNSALKCWGESWKQSIQWELLSLCSAMRSVSADHIRAAQVQGQNCCL